MKISLLTMTAALVAAQDACPCVQTNSCAPQSVCALEYKTSRKSVKKGWEKTPKTPKAPKAPKGVKLHKGKACADCPHVEESQKVVYRIEPEFIDAKPEAYTVVTTERRRGKYRPVAASESQAVESVPVEYVAPTVVESETPVEATEKRNWFRNMKDKLKKSDLPAGCANGSCGGCPTCVGAADSQAATSKNVKYVTVKVPVERRTHFSDRMKIRGVANKFAKGKCEGNNCGFDLVSESTVVVPAAEAKSDQVPVSSDM